MKYGAKESAIPSDTFSSVRESRRVAVKTNRRADSERVLCQTNEKAEGIAALFRGFGMKYGAKESAISLRVRFQ